MTEKRLMVTMPSDSVLGPFRSDESPASIRKHYGVSLDDLRRQLAAQGLHVVSAADQAVLDACKRAKFTVRGRFGAGSQAEIEAAELARREPKP